MKRSVFLLALVAALAFPIAASAHPLGNFTINRFSRIEVAGSTRGCTRDASRTAPG